MCLPVIIWILHLKNAVHQKGQDSGPSVSKHCHVREYERMTCEERMEGWAQDGKPSADGFDHQHSLLQKNTYQQFSVAMLSCWQNLVSQIWLPLLSHIGIITWTDYYSPLLFSSVLNYPCACGTWDVKSHRALRSCQVSKLGMRVIDKYQSCLSCHRKPPAFTKAT